MQSMLLHHITEPIHLKALMDFNHKVNIDGISWSNQAGKSFHFYHMIDAGTNYHVAFCAHSRTTSEVINLINQHWCCWAGYRSHLVTDSGTEFTSEEFSQFLQAYGIHGTTTSPEAHWQSGKIERHGQFLHSMLDKMDSERAASSYMDLRCT